MNKIFTIILSILLIPNLCWAGIDFDGTDDYVDGTDAFYSNTLTISCWFYITAMPDEQNKNLLEKVNSSGITASTREWELIIYEYGGVTCAGNFVGYSTVPSTIFDVNSTTALTLNTWFHVVARCDGTDADVIVDGVETDGAQSGTIANTSSLIQVGVRSNNNNNRYFDGIITEVAIWDVYLTDAQVALLYNAKLKGMPLQIATANLKIYLPMDDQETGTSADGDTIRDLAGTMNGTGVDGANNTGLLYVGETVLSYSSPILTGM